MSSKAECFSKKGYSKVAERGYREFRFPQISYIDYKQIEIDRTLLNLFPRLKFDGYMGRVNKVLERMTIEWVTATPD